MPVAAQAPGTGWSTIKRSNRMCRFGTRLSAQTTPCLAATFSGTSNATSTAARKATRCAANGAGGRSTSARSSPDQFNAQGASVANRLLPPQALFGDPESYDRSQK
jgi:hypothetical protein